MKWFFLTLFSPVLGFAKWKDLGNKNATIRLGIVVPTLELQAKPLPPLSANTLNFKPHVATRSFVSLAYGSFGVSASGMNPIAKEKEDLYGVTRSSDYQFRFYLQKLTIEAYYQKYLGYYLDNTKDVVPGWTENQQRRLYPEMSTEHMGYSFTYLFSPGKFSMSAAFEQAAKQIESGGSWLINFSASDHHVENTGSLIPVELLGTYGEYEKVQAAKLFSASLGLGGGYTFVVYESFYLTTVMVVNAAHQNLRYEKTDGIGSASKSGAQSQVKLGLGYNGDKLILGMNLINSSASYKIDSVETVFSTLETSVFLGTRFKF